MKNYIVNHNTLAILPFNKKQSLVYEGFKRIIVNEKPNNIIKNNCILDGNKIETRLHLTKKLINISYKAPILVNKKNNLIFFPTSSIRLNNVCWISLNNIDKCIYNRFNRLTIAKFINGVKLEFDISTNVFNNQILKSSRLEHYLLKNMS